MEEFKIRTFGRTKSRKISDIQNEKLNKILPKYKIEINDDKIINLPNNYDKLYFELGFGYGEHTIHQALLNKNCGIVACETYLNGVLSLLDKIQNIDNIRVFNNDARLLLERLPNSSIDKIFILFPDPWPKKRQNKRRIINSEFLNLISLKLKHDGILFFASDILDYVKWTLNYAKEKFTPVFKNLNECKIEPAWWIRTRYQEKAIKEGRTSYFLEFKNSNNSIVN